MKMKTEAEALTNILRIKERLQRFLEEKTVDNTYAGLCVVMHLNTLPNIGRVFGSWEHFSGDKAYPIPYSIVKEKLEKVERTKEVNQYLNMGLSQAEVAYDTLDLYEGEQLELRLLLAEHVLENVETMVKDYEQII